ncbi:MAG TPA: zinc-dependent metalloprotease [Burkholderiaceae bacterium]|nr:zinc-dependent metalloprotease [Burkholderiaceae bacterium]
MSKTLLRSLSLVCAGVWVLVATGCATAPAGTAGAQGATAPSAPGAAPGPARPASGAAAAPQPGQPPAFATVIKDAKKIDGALTLWQKDDKVWIELAPRDFGKAMLFAPKIAQGIGEAGLFGGTMIGPYGRYGRQQLVEFRRVHNQVQLLARNTEFRAPERTPEGRAVQAAFSPSLVGSAAVASQPHPDSKAVLIEANGIFVNDLLGIAIALQRTYRQGYAFDGRNSAITAVRGKPDQVVIEVAAHYATAGIAQQVPGGPPGPAPSMPSSLPDVRSMFLGMHYSLATLPAQPMQPRKSDSRVGYFDTVTQDFGDDLARTPRQRQINRWRLDKQDPGATLSEPVKPITFWLDRTIPLKYRDAIAKGILVWNDAFERIGFKNAVVVKTQPDDADFDTLDVGVASIRWMTNASPSFGAIGPSQIDPRTGEILDADIGFESLSSRSVRALRSQVLVSRVAVDWPALMQSSAPERVAELTARSAAGAGHAADQCQHADMAAEQLSYALDVLEARGELDPASPEAQQWVLDYLTDVTIHEVGHTLGLRHNFRSSRVYTEAQLADPEFTRKNGLAGSVMEYSPINLARPGEPAALAWQVALGPYDYWAIEYGYKPIAPEHEAAELQRIAARSNEPQLAYGTDEDNSLGIDPESLLFDLGNDPVAFAKKRFDIARDLIRRQEMRELKPNEDYSVLRRSINFALRDVARASGILARQIGGVRTLRDHPGSGRDPLLPVSAAAQRQALDLLASGVLAADSFVLSPALQRRMAPDFAERRDAIFAGDGPVATDYSLASAVIEMQRALLGSLMNDGVAQRLLDSEGKVDANGPALRLSELMQRLNGEVWSELRAGSGDIPSMRRELQREHVNRLAGLLLRPGALSRADARSLVRVQSQELLAGIQKAAQRKGLSGEARAHLQDSADTLRQALTAPLMRQGA